MVCCKEGVVFRSRLNQSNYGHYLLAWFCLLFSNAFGQTDSNVRMQSPNKFDYGIQFRFGPSNRQNQNEIAISDYSGYYLNSELLSMRYDLNAFAKFSDRWAVFTGVSYSNRNYFATYYCHVCDLGIHPLESDRFNFRYIDLPVYVRYRIHDWKINWHFEFGTEVSFAINQCASNYDSDIRLNDYSMNVFVGSGIDYDLNRRINVNATLSYRNLILSNSNYSFRALEAKIGMIYYLKN